MTQPTFNYVEEYIEFIGGRRSITGKVLSFFDIVGSPLSLARYDVNIIDSLSSQTADTKSPYTDKQAALSIKLVDKYRKQLAQHNVIVPEKLDQFKLGIRQVDRTKTIGIEDDQFIMKFPFDAKLVDMVKRQLKEGRGSGKFDYDRRVWRLGMTEYTLNWIVTIGTLNNFEISEQVRSLFNRMMSIEQSEYKIELVRINGQLTITNASKNLIGYINETLGGFDNSNLLILVDNSGVLGYTVSKELRTEIANQYPAFYRMIYKRKLKVKQRYTMEDVLAYAKLVNRMPVHVYDQGLPKKNNDQVIYMNRSMDYNVNSKLLITHTDMMIGRRKESWIINSEKIFIIQ